MTMVKHNKCFIVGKNKEGARRLEENPADVYRNDIFIGTISDEEYEFIDDRIAAPACIDHGIFFCEFEFDEIPPELVDYFFDLIGDDRDKAPVFCEALEWCKKSGGAIKVCF
jgi:hypothetical protein